MDYQLVIKFWRASMENKELLPAIQDELKNALGDTATLDGFDVSAQEINLFVVTPDPKSSFRRIKKILESRNAMRGVSAAYRVMGGAQFNAIWPLRPLRKFTLP